MRARKSRGKENMKIIKKEKMLNLILEELKNHSPKQEGFDIDNKKTRKGKYYYKDYGDNLYQHKMSPKYYEQYLNGDGKELSKNQYGLIRMAALRSSSALIFNILGDESGYMKVKDRNKIGISGGLYSVEFEKKMYGIGLFPPNVDAFLESNNNDTVILIENKMLEPFYRSEANLKPSYLNVNSYHDLPDDIAEAYVKTFLNICVLKNGSYVIKDRYRLFYVEFFQLLKHTLGFIGERVKGNYQAVKNVYLLNSIWWVPYTRIISDIYRKIPSLGYDMAAFTELDVFAPIIEIYKKYGMTLKVEIVSHIDLAFYLFDLDDKRNEFICEKYCFKKCINGQNMGYENGYYILKLEDQSLIMSPFPNRFPNAHEFKIYFTSIINIMSDDLPLFDIENPSFSPDLASDLINKRRRELGFDSDESHLLLLSIGLYLSREISTTDDKRYMVSLFLRYFEKTNKKSIIYTYWKEWSNEHKLKKD
jgi:hypothetical protein